MKICTLCKKQTLDGDINKSTVSSSKQSYARRQYLKCIYITLTSSSYRIMLQTSAVVDLKCRLAPQRANSVLQYSPSLKASSAARGADKHAYGHMWREFR
jgi:hypothetical protein